jgi:hypothetical protein
MYEKMRIRVYLSERIVVWLTGDKRRIPICMESESLLGQVNAVLEFAGYQ